MGKRWLGLVVAAFVGLTVAEGCVSLPVYACKSGDVCVSGSGAQGMCEPNAHCSFTDSACASTGRRYGTDGADALSGTCVAPVKSCVQKLALGNPHSCLLATDGGVWCWGGNAAGQLGDGTTTSRSVPTKVVGLPGPASSISAGDSLTCAIVQDQTVWCWGDNATLQLGQCGAAPPASSTKPVQVSAYVVDGQGKLACDPKPFKATVLSVGGKHVCALGVSGDVYCWGENSTGQCGQDPADPKFEDVPGPLPISGPVSGIKDVQTGDEFGCSLKDDGSAYCWGSNALGSLGDGTGVDSYKPVGVSGLLSVAALAIGDEAACARTAEGGIWCWGNGASGILGASFANGTKAVRLTSADRVYFGDVASHVCTTSVSGDLKCWGANLKGQTGVGNLEPSITAPTTAKLITVKEMGLGEEHTCALTKDGALYCWGNNSDGQLGLGAASDAPTLTPTRVPFSCP